MERTRVLLVRHADVHNPQDVFYGRLPRYGLSALGRQQAEQAARYLADFPIAAIATSPLLRARQTAAILAQPHPGVPVVFSRLLLEVSTSVQGTPFKVLGSDVNVYDRRKLATDESIAEIYSRMHKILLRLARTYSGATSVAVSHADPIMILRAGVQGLPFVIDNIRGPNYPAKGSITEFAFAPGVDTPEITYTDVIALTPAGA